MSKILFLNPISFSAENVVRDSIYGCWCKGKRIGGAMTPPYPQLELATLMRSEGHIVEVIDALAQEMSIEKVLDLMKRDYDYLVILTSVMTFREDSKLLQMLKDRSPRTVMIVYGSLPTFLPDMALSSEGIDIIIRREPEYILRDFVALHSKGDSDWKSVKGLGFRGESGAIVLNEFYPFIENLDDLPLVDWSLLKQSKHYFNPSVKRTPYVTELVTRGCPGLCTFCMSPAFYGHEVRSRSPENVLKALEQHVANGVREVYFRDEMFTAFKDNVRAVCKGIIERKLDLTWICSIRAGSVSHDDLKLMKEAGCHLLKVGVESGSQEILKRVKKGITLKQVRDLFKWAREIGIDTHAHLMVGFPGETPETILETIEHAIAIKPTTVTFGMLTPYPGTQIFEQEVLPKYPQLAREYTLDLENLHSNPFCSDAYCAMSPDDLSKWLFTAHKKFYLRPSYILERLFNIRSFYDLITLLRAGLNVIRFSLFGDKKH